jgi:uncharacterized protein YbjT (DUF2867 family)
MAKTALLIGGTGLVGSALLRQLLDDPAYGRVIAFGRRAPQLQHPKLEAHVVDLGQPDSYKALLKGDVLFSSLGTTKAQAGSEAAQYEVDYTFQYRFAQAAAQAGVPTYVLVSSVGADAGSRWFYMRMKGELDDAVQLLGFPRVHVLRPGPLAGPRAQPRGMEKFSMALLRALNAIGLFKTYRPILDTQVAAAMRAYAARPENGNFVHEALELFEIKG